MVGTDHGSSVVIADIDPCACAHCGRPMLLARNVEASVRPLFLRGDNRPVRLWHRVATGDCCRGPLHTVVAAARRVEADGQPWCWWGLHQLRQNSHGSDVAHPYQLRVLGPGAVEARQDGRSRTCWGGRASYVPYICRLKQWWYVGLQGCQPSCPEIAWHV